MDTLLKHRTAVSLALAVGAACAASALAEEAGSGHYAPGGMASFIDALPARPGLAVANYFMYYDAGASGRPLPFGGLNTFDSHAQAYSDSVLVLYKTPLELLGGNYSAGLVLPYVWREVDGYVTVMGQGGALQVRMGDTANG
ncbi:MAG TPA: hypothetical protein VJA21_04595, partial [Verrucomicrobiae bacterium]